MRVVVTERIYKEYLIGQFNEMRDGLSIISESNMFQVSNTVLVASKSPRKKSIKSF